MNGRDEVHHTDAVRAGLERALELGRTARLISPPNPWVGCVILNDGVPVGEGHTSIPGGDHAEVVALKAAGERARGATAVVTLEPCAHHGRTGPCVEALIAAGIVEVIFVLRDPDPQVNGAGQTILRASGITARCLQDSTDPSDAEVVAEVERDFAPYLWHRTHGRPWVVAKIGMSLDANVAAVDGSSRWITGAEARLDAHLLRAQSDGILVGANTAIADQPSLTVRDVEQPNRVPQRIVLDGRGRVEPVGPITDTQVAPTVIVTTEAMEVTRSTAWESLGAEVLRFASTNGRVPLHELLDELGRRGMLQLMIEGGGHTIGAFAEAGLLQALRCYIAPTLLGTGAIPAFDIPGVEHLDEARRMELVSVQRFGDDVRLEFQI